MAAPRSRHFWKDKEIALLRKLYAADYTDEQIGAVLNLSASAVKQRRIFLGLIRTRVTGHRRG